MNENNSWSMNTAQQSPQMGQQMGQQVGQQMNVQGNQNFNNGQFEPYQQQTMYNQNQFVDKNAPDYVLTIKDWLIMTLLMCVPIVNIIVIIRWCISPNAIKHNYMRAMMIVALIGIIFTVIMSMLGAVLGVAFMASDSANPRSTSGEYGEYNYDYNTDDYDYSTDDYDYSTDDYSTDDYSTDDYNNNTYDTKEDSTDSY